MKWENKKFAKIIGVGLDGILIERFPRSADGGGIILLCKQNCF